MDKLTNPTLASLRTFSDLRMTPKGPQNRPIYSFTRVETHKEYVNPKKPPTKCDMDSIVAFLLT